MDITQYLIWFGFFLAGTYAHEAAHFFVAAVLKLSPRMDLWKLEVSYNYTPDDWKVRVIGLAPWILGILYFFFEILYVVVLGGNFRTRTVLFLIGLLIGSSMGDFSVAVARKGTWTAYDNVSRGVRLMLGGIGVAVVSSLLKLIPGLDQIAVEIIKGALEASAVVVFGVGAFIYISRLTKEQKALS